MSFACIYAPDFPVQAVLRAEREPHQQAVAILDGTPPVLTVVSLNEMARQKGMQIGMTKVQAELFQVKLFQRKRAQESATHQALRDCACAFSPRVEDTAFWNASRCSSLKKGDGSLGNPSAGDFPEGGGDTLILDIDGLGRRYGSHHEIAQVLKQLAGQFKLEVHVGVAANPEASLMAARGFSGITVIPPGSEAKFLGPLPIDILNLPTEVRETFRSWGIRSLQELAALPEIGLIQRLGQEGKRLQDLARGVDQRPLIPMEPAMKFEESMELESAVVTLEALTFILAALLKQLCARLVARSLAANELNLVLQLEDQMDDEFSVIIPGKGESKTHRISLRLPLPVQNSKTLLKLLQLKLKAHPPESAVKEVWLAAEAVRPRKTQGELFLPRGPEPEQMEITLARITTIVGDDRVGSPVVCNTHKPDAFQIKKFLPTATTTLSPPSPLPQWRRGESNSDSYSHPHGSSYSCSLASSREDSRMPGERRATPVASKQTTLPRSPLRRYRPPIPVRVEIKDNAPAFVSFLKRRRKVLNLAGPWRSDGDWWKESHWAREEWDITFVEKTKRPDSGNLYESLPGHEVIVCRLYYDLQTKQWFVEGVYD
jgi:protein ImuB